MGDITFLAERRAEGVGSPARRKYQFQKIQRAIEDELAAGGTIDGLSPIEVRHRLCKRMRARKLTDSEIPSERCFRYFFNGK